MSSLAPRPGPSRLPGLLVAAFLLAAQAPGDGRGDGEELLPGPARERFIGAQDQHVYRAEAGEDPLLITVEQRGIDLVLELVAPGAEGRQVSDSPNGRWGPEVLLLPATAAGTVRLEVRPATWGVPSGRYAIQIERLRRTTPEAVRRAEALAAMSRAGQLVPGPPAGRSEALAAYRRAAAAWSTLGDPRWQAEAVLDVAVLEQLAGDLRAALTAGRQALALWRQLSEPRRVAATLAGLGLCHQSAGEAAMARAAMEESVALWRSLDETAEEERIRGDLCLLEQTSGDLPSALACHQGLLVLHQGHDNPSGEATVRNNLGGVYDSMGEPDAALEHYGKALALWQALGDRAEEAKTLNNLAVVHRSLGEWQEALRVYERARQILLTLGNRVEEAKLLNNVGFAYDSLGEPQRALVFFEEGLRLRRESGDRRGEVISLNNLGATRRELGELDHALDHHRQALERAVALGDRRQEALSRLGLAEVDLDLRDTRAALGQLEAALPPLRQSGLLWKELQALGLRGRALAAGGWLGEARAVLEEVLARRRALRDRAGEAETLHALATVERRLGLLVEARGHAAEAVARVEQLRTGFASADLRAAFLATRRRAYELAIDLLMEQHAAEPEGGHEREALAMSEQVQARTLLDALHAGGGGRGSSASPELLERRRSLRRRLNARAAQQARQGVEARVETLGREMESILAELDGVEAEIRRQDPGYAALSEPPGVSAAQIAGLLDPDTLLLEYALGEERSFLWTVGARGLSSHVLPPREEVEGLARQVHADLSTAGPGSERQSEAVERLGRILLGPVWPQAAALRRLLVVPDGALHVLPFAALRLPDPGRGWDASGSRRPLLEHLEVVYLPSATTLALQRRRLAERVPAPRWVAVLADPVFSAQDPRLAELSPGANAEPGQRGAVPVVLETPPGTPFERLPSSRREGEAIAALAPAGEAWMALDLAASREAVLSGKLRGFRVLHFATHGVADTRNPWLSGLVLSLVDAAGRAREGFLGLPDLYELDLAADLVVLSGCRTALGKEVRGEGLMGLTRGFLHAGVPRVVGSLWPVEDRASMELMSRFYRAMWQDGLAPAAALRQAQLSLKSEPRYRDPHSWAAFVLQGDWR